MRLIDAPRCPFCARARLVLAEKNVDFETVVIDLGNRPSWVLRLRELYGVTLPARIESWLEGLLERPGVAAELEVVKGIA